MWRRATPWLAALLATVGCTAGGSGEQQARAAFTAFQEALFRRDTNALRALTCREAHPVLATLCAKDRRDQPKVDVVGVERRGYEYLVQVRDPAQPEAEHHYVLTVEDGAMRVDLGATIRANSTTKRSFLDRPTFQPQQLSEQQVRDAQAQRLAR